MCKCFAENVVIKILDFLLWVENVNLAYVCQLFSMQCIYTYTWINIFGLFISCGSANRKRCWLSFEIFHFVISQISLSHPVKFSECHLFAISLRAEKGIACICNHWLAKGDKTVWESIKYVALRIHWATGSSFHRYRRGSSTTISKISDNKMQRGARHNLRTM